MAVLSTPADPADAAGVAEVVGALESSLYPASSFSQADLEDEWRELDLGRDTRVVRDGGRIVGYGAIRERGEPWRVEAYVHPEACGRGIGTLLATELEAEAARHGSHSVQNGVLEADSAACRLLESLGYRDVRVFRELRIELDAEPPAPVAGRAERRRLRPARRARLSRRASGGLRGRLALPAARLRLVVEGQHRGRALRSQALVRRA